MSPVNVAGAGTVEIRSDTAFSAGTLNAARRAAGAVAHSEDIVLL
jgi:hypothetical protein